MEENKGMSVVRDFLVQNDGSLRLSVRQPAVDNQSISLRYDSISKKKGSFGWKGHSKLPLGRGGKDIQQSENSFIVIEEPT